MTVWLDGVEVWDSPTFIGTPVAPTAPVDTDTTQLATTEFVNNQLEQGTQPTLVALSVSPSQGGVYNGGFDFYPTFISPQTVAKWIDGTAAGSATNMRYGWNFYVQTNPASVMFDTEVTHSGGASLKISLTSALGAAAARNTESSTTLSRDTPLLKPSTKYRLSAWVKTHNVSANGVYITARQYDVAAGLGNLATTPALTGTNDWTYLYVDFTSDADVGGSYLLIWLVSYVAGNISDVWFDDVKLEEIVHDTTFTGLVPTQARPTILGVTTTDNIDQSLDYTWAYANHYTCPAAISETATNRQTFTPTKSHITQISVYMIDAPDDMHLYIHDSSNNILARYTLSAPSQGVITFNVPCLWESGTYHFHVLSDSGEITIASNTHEDMETASYIQYFAKHTENVTIVCNGEKIALDSDSDGMLTGSVIDIDKGKYSYKGSTSYTSSKNNDVYDCSAGTRTDDNSMVKGWVPSFTLTTATMFTSPGTISTQAYITYKVNTLLPVKHLVLYTNFYTNPINITRYIAVSSDGINWTTIGTDSHPVNGYYQQRVETDVVNGLSTFYIKLYKDTTVSTFAAGIHSIEADLDTSSVPSIVLQPLGTQVQFSENVYLSSTVDRVYLRTNKYLNDRGIIMPHLEFCSTTTPVVAVPLKVDNHGETNPAVKVIAADTPTSTIGTGTNDGDGNWIINNGEYIGITGTADTTVEITYRVGKGTLLFENLTMNRFYLSSNGSGINITTNPSFQFDFNIGMLKESSRKTTERTCAFINDLEIAQDSMTDFVITSIGEVEMSNRYPSEDVVLPEGYCVDNILGMFEIAPWKLLVLGNDTVFEICR